MNFTITPFTKIVIVLFIFMILSCILYYELYKHTKDNKTLDNYFKYRFIYKTISLVVFFILIIFLLITKKL